MKLDKKPVQAKPQSKTASKITLPKNRPAVKPRSTARQPGANRQSCSGVYNKAYNEAYDKGFNDGYAKGLEDGALDD